ncbi:MAG: long-chain fatty acid--CoA ligase [Cupriavidus necator]
MPQLQSPFWPKRLPRHLSVPQTSLSFNLEVTARRHPDKPAIVFYDSTLTYAQLKDQAERMAGFLQQVCGVAKGDRVILYTQNSPQFVIGYYAILRADAVVIPVNPMNKTGELRHYVTDSDATVALTTQELYPQLAPLLADGGLRHAVVGAYSDALDAPTDLPVPGFVREPRRAIAGPGVTLWGEAIARGLAPAPARASPDDLCVMPYTSGTTGNPKGCMHTHRTVMTTLVGGAAWIGTPPDAVVLATLPMFHVTGMQANMNAPIHGGNTVVVLPRWDADAAAALVQRYRVNDWAAIATMVVDLLSSPRLAEFDLSSLARIKGGGAAMPEAVAQRLQDLLGLRYIEGYGLSETMAPVSANPPEHPKKQCGGIPIFDTDARIVDPTTLMELPQGEVGEIVVNAPQVFLGYWKAPEATQEAFMALEGKQFFRTGDLGYLDEEGYLFIVDRLKRMINAAGFKVWPAEVENILYQHPAVQEACVIAARDPHRGETVKAVLVLKQAFRGQVSEQDIVAWAKDNMAAYKYPRLIEFRDELPRSGTGKVQWRVLQELELQKH